ncbi:DUF1311 domain-containing protein [Leptotrichia sp. OH3620_COT-345]|uniref:lysozyme inhibitor LprI family protein n=1 Tax=Leptotrichia sp. OH3620_COT-345 TaxID=2491048 RepID=UPI000F6551C7|nr:lysozyme inhibitor LprI family protein [Leptotrichia sp. OH3620_COT-345]RRD39835.1 DUF1311 domain-containing protein [Leptotrichia sp. OH3620_COT-345]
MKRLLFILIFLFAVGCSEKKIAEKRNGENIVNKVDTSLKEDTKKEKNYEISLLERMVALEKELKPALDSGVTADMSNAAATLSEAWEEELNKIYGLLISELSEKEKEKLRTVQRDWLSKKKKEAEESEGGNIAVLLSSGRELELTKERTVELAKMYDSMHR